MANHTDPRKAVGLRLEESVLAQIDVQAKAQQVSPAEYRRKLILTALEMEPGGGFESLGVSAEVRERMQEEAHARNIPPADYLRSLIYDALTKDPGVEIDELRRTVTGLNEQVSALHAQQQYLHHAMRHAFEALLITSAEDAPRHTTAQIEVLLEAVFPKG